MPNSGTGNCSPSPHLLQSTPNKKALAHATKLGSCSFFPFFFFLSAKFPKFCVSVCIYAQVQLQGDRQFQQYFQRCARSLKMWVWNPSDRLASNPYLPPRLLNNRLAVLCPFSGLTKENGWFIATSCPTHRVLDHIHQPRFLRWSESMFLNCM